MTIIFPSFVTCIHARVSSLCSSLLPRVDSETKSKIYLSIFNLLHLEKWFVTSNAAVLLSRYSRIPECVLFFVIWIPDVTVLRHHSQSFELSTSLV